MLQGVNTYLEWYKDYYGALDGGSSALDVPHLRRALPAANCVRFVGLLWKDSIKASDGLECFVNDASKGYLEDECVRYIDAMVKQATDAGLWVILAARAKYAAGWSGPDVWHSATMRRQMLAMWSFVARRYKDIDRIAGYEIMSEPRTKTVAQARERDFMREGCEAVHAADPGALCVVGPRQYYKLWELNDDVLRPPDSSTLYTFDFVPKDTSCRTRRRTATSTAAGGPAARRVVFNIRSRAHGAKRRHRVPLSCGVVSVFLLNIFTSSRWSGMTYSGSISVSRPARVQAEARSSRPISSRSVFSRIIHLDRICRYTPGRRVRRARTCCSCPLSNRSIEDGAAELIALFGRHDTERTLEEAAGRALDPGGPAPRVASLAPPEVAAMRRDPQQDVRVVARVAQRADEAGARCDGVVVRVEAQQRRLDHPEPLVARRVLIVLIDGGVAILPPRHALVELPDGCRGAAEVVVDEECARIFAQPSHSGTGREHPSLGR